QVLTVQDVSFLDHPEWYSRQFSAWYGWLIPRLVRRVSHVITSSNFSKDSIIRKTGISERKLSVIPLGVDLKEFYPKSPGEIDAVRQVLQIPATNYILSFCTLE